VKQLIILLLISFKPFSQILKDPIAKSWILEGLNKSYNFQFAEAEEIYNKIKLKYPTNPAYSTLMQMMLFTQHAPIKENAKVKAQYILHLNKAVELSEKMIAKNENDTEGIFFMLSSLGSLAAWQADNEEMMKAVNTARKAFPYMKKGMKLTDIQADFLFTTGLYNYYIEQYPEDHPIVKPFMIFFSDGNKKLGLQQMEGCSNKAIFTHVEAAYYSAYIYLKHESRSDKALIFMNNLMEKYPNNLLFVSKKAECLVNLARYDIAKPLVENLLKSQGKLYPLAGFLFQGIIEEKQAKNDILAEAFYKKVLKIPADVRFTQDYHAIAYLGLARISLREKNKKQAKQYLEKAIELSEYQSTDSEAKRLLKNF
jgi:tetratricopeptide (TPR) repeat protein